MLGISVYLSEDINQQASYIKKMNNNGFKSIFTSLHIPEDDHTNYKHQLKELGQLAKKLDMELMADISPNSLKVLGFDWGNAEGLVHWGVSGVRVDYGVDEQTIINLSNKMKIAINASTLSIESLKRMKQNGLNTESVEAWHNFYPRPETGLGLSDFIKQNKSFAAEGITVMAFIPGDDVLRGPLHMKLPTLEKHRFQPPFVSYLEMIKDAYVDKVFIGDPNISSETLSQFDHYQKGVIHLRAVSDKNTNESLRHNVAGTHTNRADYARDCIRSIESRHYASIGENSLQPQNCVTRYIGSITVDNVNYLRYQGEIQVTVNDLPADDKVNVVGRVIEKDRPLLQWIKSSQKFNIEWV